MLQFCYKVEIFSTSVMILLNTYNYEEKRVSTTLEQNNASKKKIYTTEEVRNLLNTDNKGISQLCKQVYVSPKKDKRTGQTFFLDTDVEILRKISDLHAKGQRIMDSKKLDNSSTKLAVAEKAPESRQTPSVDLTALTNSIVTAQEGILEKIATILDDKLEGLDEVVVELIRCKTDIERQRVKIDDLTRENYQLKNDLEKFQSVGLGLYIKRINTLL